MGRLKITGEHFNALKQAINSIPELETYRESYKSQGLSDTRFRWDCYNYVTKEGDGRLGWEFAKELYKYLDDSNIDSALKQIVG